MFSYQVYKLVHLFGIFLTIVSLGSMYLHAMNGGTKETNPSKKLMSISHGLGLFLVLLGGFGMLARLNLMQHMPGWVIAKLVIWVVLGGALAIPARAPQYARPLYFAIPILGVLAGYFAIYKPF